MSSASYNLTTTPVQVSDGSKTIYIQERSGSGTKFTSSTVTPDSNTPYCTINDSDISLPSGFPIWCWADTAVTITVLTSEV